MISIPNDNNGSSLKEIPKAGLRAAYCYYVVDLGVQDGGPTYDNKHQILAMFELNETIMEEGEYFGKKFVISKFYNLSAYEKSNLAVDTKNWLGIEIEPEMNIDEILVGKVATLNIAHKATTKDPSKERAQIATINPPMDQMEDWEIENGPKIEGWHFPNWVQKIREKAITKPEDFGTCPFEPDTTNKTTSSHAGADTNSY